MPRTLFRLVPAAVAMASPTLRAAEGYELPRCEALPLPNREVSFQIAGEERIRWNASPDAPRPFFYPLAGPSGGCLTRMGHPGAPDHDHHRSVWFAHHDVEGTDFWSESGPGIVRQKRWLAYRDGSDEAVMACLLGWFDGKGAELMEQELVAALIPLTGNDYAVELQSSFVPAAGRESIMLGKTNFGLLAVRVAKSMSEAFGGGSLSSSEGAQHEPAIFGKKARWMDYSGPVATGTGASRKAVIQGITYFDHPQNPRYPSAWHVRQDGWMGAAFCLEEPFQVQRETPLRLRYLLHAHGGPYRPETADLMQREFARRAQFEVVKGKPPFQWEVRRATSSSQAPH